MATQKKLKVSQMAENLIGSEIIKLAAEIQNRMKTGEKIYNMTIGDFDPKIFPIPKELEEEIVRAYRNNETNSVSYTHLRAHETVLDLVCRLLLEKKQT